MSKHTPGPWGILINKKLKEIGIVSEKLHQRGTTKCGICEIIITSPEDLANARLIAAAPEMLQLLTDLIFCLENRGVGLPEIEEIIKEAKEVIKKVEGNK